MALGFETDRLKTGTPSRVDARTIDYSVLESQPGDDDVRWFSFDPEVRTAAFTTCLCCGPRLLTAQSFTLGYTYDCSSQRLWLGRAFRCMYSGRR